MIWAVSIYGTTSFHEISARSRRLEIECQNMYKYFKLSNPTGMLAIALSRYLSNFKAIGQFQIHISRLRHFTSSYYMTPYCKLKQCPGDEEFGDMNSHMLTSGSVTSSDARVGILRIIWSAPCPLMPWWLKASAGIILRVLHKQHVGLLHCKFRLLLLTKRKICYFVIVASENIVCVMAAILFRGRWVNSACWTKHLYTETKSNTSKYYVGLLGEVIHTDYLINHCQWNTAIFFRRVILFQRDIQY